MVVSSQLIHTYCRPFFSSPLYFCNTSCTDCDLSLCFFLVSHVFSLTLQLYCGWVPPISMPSLRTCGQSTKIHVLLGAGSSFYQRSALALSPTSAAPRNFSLQSLGRSPQHETWDYSTRRLAASFCTDNPTLCRLVSHDSSSIDVSSNFFFSLTSSRRNTFSLPLSMSCHTFFLLSASHRTSIVTFRCLVDISQRQWLSSYVLHQLPNWQLGILSSRRDLAQPSHGIDCVFAVFVHLCHLMSRLHRLLSASHPEAT